MTQFLRVGSPREESGQERERERDVYTGEGGRRERLEDEREVGGDGGVRWRCIVGCICRSGYSGLIERRWILRMWVHV